jgi:hypothetical protein
MTMCVLYVTRRALGGRCVIHREDEKQVIHYTIILLFYYTQMRIMRMLLHHLVTNVNT